MSMICRHCFVAVIFLLVGMSPLITEAQTPVLIENEDFKGDAQTAIDSLYNRNPDSAREILNPWMEQFPDHPLWTLWKGMELWWTVLNDLHNEQYDDEFFHVMRRADYEASQLLRNHRDHPDALIIRAIANGYTARHHSNREEWLTAANIGRRAYQAYSRLMEVLPSLPDNDFAEGMKRYYAAYIPENYPAVRAVSWFLPDGNREEGLELLQVASEEGVFARPEATYFLGNILLNYEGDYEKALLYFRQLVDQYPSNSYFRRLYARTLNELKRYEELIVFSNESIEYTNDDSLPDNMILLEEIYYWKGIAQYRTGEMQDAIESFTQSYRVGRQLPNPDKRPIQALSAYHAGRTSERLNNVSQAEHFYEIVLNHKNSEDAKTQAKRRLEALK
jgi:tetratricopeptide (TPR) repeat protein